MNNYIHMRIDPQLKAQVTRLAVERNTTITAIVSDLLIALLQSEATRRATDR